MIVYDIQRYYIYTFSLKLIGYWHHSTVMFRDNCNQLRC